MKDSFFDVYRKYKYTRHEKKSFSQCGEDLIIDYIFYQLGIGKPRYIDIGAYHPFILSNTYLFYLKGARGVNIEPDPSGISLLNKYRSRDINLNVGVGQSEFEETAQFFLMTSRRLNTLVEEEARRIEETSRYRIKKMELIKLLPINQIFENYFHAAPDFISVDVEGFDLEIIKSINYRKYRPKVICVETVIFKENMPTEKNEAIIQFLTDQNYFVYADTFVNTIFVDRKVWNKSYN
ncbi:MAG: FkbM family methyltransferase [Chitinophagaceae bacterium]|nr:FkbM family methyltransferase [Chitinophagaceae bacterium]